MTSAAEPHFLYPTSLNSEDQVFISQSLFCWPHALIRNTNMLLVFSLNSVNSMLCFQDQQPWTAMEWLWFLVCATAGQTHWLFLNTKSSSRSFLYLRLLALYHLASHYTQNYATALAFPSCDSSNLPVWDWCDIANCKKVAYLDP